MAEHTEHSTQIAPPRTHSIGYELLFTVAIISVLLVSALLLVPAITGRVRPAETIIFSALMPVITLAILSVIERLLPAAGPRKSLGSWLMHFQLNIFFFILSGIVGALTLTGTNSLARDFGVTLGVIDLAFANGKGLLLVMLATWIAAIGQDFFFYWFHRMLHVSPFFWQHHKMHHMDPEVEAVTAARQNWMEVVISTFMITIPLALIFKTSGLKAWQLGLVSGTIITTFDMILHAGHANVRIGGGRTSMFWCSPQLHRIHHSLLPEHQDKNFAFVFPVWDVLFGTYYAPKPGEYPPTGVRGEKEISSFWEAQIFTPREWRKYLRAQKEAARRRA